MIFLKRKFVKTIQDLNLRGIYPSRMGFESLFIIKKWPRWNYIFYSDKEWESLVRDALGDCIGEGRYIGYTDNRQTMKVTAEGRDFIQWSFFLTKYYNEQGVFIKILFSGFMGGVFWLIVGFIKSIVV